MNIQPLRFRTNIAIHHPFIPHWGVTVTIRAWKDDDDAEHLTRMLHRAYAPLAAAGMRYTATHQSSDVTLRRLRTGHALVAEEGGMIIGTLTVYRPDRESSVETYRDPHTYHFGQFAVDPGHKGRGIGRALHQAAIRHAIDEGARFMALDTASPATDLITTYQRWGYEIVDRMDHSSTNYISVIMRLDLRSHLPQRISEPGVV